MKIQEHYEKYWKRSEAQHSFWSYERNWVLPQLFSKKEKVLDLACGDGAVSEYLSREKGLEVIGADWSREALAVVKKRGLKAVHIDVEKPLPFKDGEFDTVFWGDNVEHIFDPEDTLKEIARVIKKGGRLILSCPNMSYWRYRLHYLFFGNLADSEWSGNPPWRWMHIRFFNKKVMSDFLATQNFMVKRFLGASRRLPDRFLLKVAPKFFGMIMVIEATKK